MFDLTPTLPLGGISREWPGFHMREIYMGELVSLSFDAQARKEFETSFKKALGAAPPRPNQWVEVENGLAFWSATDQIMLLKDGANINADIEISGKFNGSAYTTLQSDAWASFKISGDKTLDVLERFIPLDLQVSPQHFAARTSAHHMAVMMIKLKENEYLLLTPRSSAHSFYEALMHSADNVL